jgi:hypothetical protein
MTKLQPNKSVTRETAVSIRGEELVVTLHPKYLSIRLKGKQARTSEVNVPYDAAYDLGRKLAARWIKK